MFICQSCHDKIDNKHTLKDEVYYLPALAQWRYCIWTVGEHRTETVYLIDKVIDPPFWEDGYGEVWHGTRGVAETLTFEEWAEKCKSIGSFRHSLGFLIGDLVILGEDNFGEKAWQYLSEMGYEDRSIGNMVRVCRAIPPERRRGTLTYSHHVVVYKFPESGQDEWLEQAEGMTVKAFRELVHGVKERPVYRCPECGHQAELKEFKI